MEEMHSLFSLSPLKLTQRLNETTYSTLHERQQLMNRCELPHFSESQSHRLRDRSATIRDVTEADGKNIHWIQPGLTLCILFPI